jgi:hypothetical protein
MDHTSLRRRPPQIYSRRLLSMLCDIIGILDHWHSVHVAKDEFFRVGVFNICEQHDEGLSDEDKKDIQASFLAGLDVGVFKIV